MRKGIRAALNRAAVVACSGNSFSVSKQSLAGWGAEGVFLAFCSQSEAAGVFGQVETATLPGAGCVFVCAAEGVC